MNVELFSIPQHKIDTLVRALEILRIKTVIYYKMAQYKNTSHSHELYEESLTILNAEDLNNDENYINSLIYDIVHHKLEDWMLKAYPDNVVENNDDKMIL